MGFIERLRVQVVRTTGAGPIFRFIRDRAGGLVPSRVTGEGAYEGPVPPHRVRIREEK